MHEGEIITVEATELVAGGDALARIDGFPVFTSGIFPGDVARVRLYEVKKGFAKADLVELTKPSSWRRAAPCPIANECGGCDWTALRLDKQLEAKRRILSESLRRIGKFDVAALPEIALHPSPLNYRLRSRLHRDGDAVGFYAMRSNRVVPLVEECEVVGVQTARTPFEGEQWELGGAVIPDERELTITVEGFTYHLHTRAFFQVNRHLLGTLLRLVSGHAAGVRNRGSAVDLYAGVGFFTLPIAKLFDQVTMIEGSAVSVHYARRNVPPNVKVVDAPVERQIEKLAPADFVFLDPPRAGARREVITAIGEKTREVISFLSCDPVTFARDANRLVAAGWKLASLDLLDLFPNTHHVETLGRFERR
ncbi:MAG TPA: TRAM domain-containing protein [Thermoanaerobaculia bacterium]|nr:TRAM domain-containing protein [Thermoanaerobaculia bacterium]